MKIMTATIALENGDLEDAYKVGEEVLEMYGTNIYLEVGEKMKLRDLLYGLILRSGNDSAVVIAKGISGSEENFVTLMNNKAKDIGMSNTVFNNAHGLDEKTKNYSTAHDMALLSSYIYKNSKEYRKITSTYKYEVSSNNKSYLWYNRNKFLKQYKFATGGKTGYTPSAGKTLVSTSSKDGLRLTAVSLKDPNHYQNHINLYDYVYDKYKNYTILDKDNFSLGDAFYQDKVYIKKSFKYPLTEKEKEKVKTMVKVTKLSGYKTGDKVGVVDIYLGDDIIGNVSVYVDSTKQKRKQSFFSKLFS
ncbi:MAG: D-alanyl-D-alanine carboxypeptidase [Bacilli bacterium]|nr:D-alanyl-D-alanine carboxypeptidase [Bacilli bacterium]